MNIILIAPPLAGKGTQAKLFSEKFNIPHISTGDLLREEASKETELGVTIKEMMNSGALVADQIVLDLLESRLSKPDTYTGFILDGFPRNVNQAKMLEEILDRVDKTIEKVIYLDIDADVAISRLKDRYVCLGCGASYSYGIPTLKPKKVGLCDKCDSSLIQREDDKEETFKKRFDTYLTNTYPLIKYYEEENILAKINASLSLPKDIFNEILKVLK